jgi:hypothetical protein
MGFFEQTLGSVSLSTVNIRNWPCSNASPTTMCGTFESSNPFRQGNLRFVMYFNDREMHLWSWCVFMPFADAEEMIKDIDPLQVSDSCLYTDFLSAHRVSVV